MRSLYGKTMNNSPGTVSKILWHFTGGPLWNDKTNKQGKRPKPAKDSYAALKSILSTKLLKVGKYQEVVKTIIPEKREYNITTKKFEIKKNVKAMIKSSRVCCVAEIPIQHLNYHSERYGKIAIGFHRDAVVHAGFNPVLYTLEESFLSKNIHNGYSSIENFDTSWASSEIDDLESEIVTLLDEHEIDETLDASGIQDALSDIESETYQIQSYYEDILAYIKTFKKSEFDSIYCEREWRSTSDYKFDLSDIAMIVLPKRVGNANYYKPFLSATKLPRTVPILSWEDLIEH